MRTQRRFQASLESLEGKALLSTLPVLSQTTFNGVLHQIDKAAGTFAKTHNPNAFDAALSQISYKIPYGHSQLYPTWQADESIYDSTVPGSGQQMVQQLKTDLTAFVQSEVAADAIRLRGQWGGLGVSASTRTDPVVTPVLSHSTYQNAFKQINRAAGTFAKTHNAVAFDAALATISEKIPYGHGHAYPTWQADESIYDPTVPGSGQQMVQQIRADLQSYVQTSVADGLFRVH